MGSRSVTSKGYFYAYVAGFLDGDGCISIKFERNKTCRLGYRARVRISFTQHRTRRKVLDLLRKEIGSGVVTEYNHNNMAEYVINDQRVINILLNNIEPYVYVKKKHLKLAKKLLLLKRKGYTPFSLRKMFNLFKEVGVLNNYPKKVTNLTP